ncbi:MAG: bifunctional [glutamate--ammonia ligase]-adenylyl-L-tyrosine phosphorylase/[glutamate--ammonia-ligase] adenylyltransferase, partial [Halioglobus sp.]|nr:bifunctional [glutamate--ammonia ligase]-adenylyl-L-tyrosine phosphorylase/[glutamate--ammonia-ligase] adenylyltransferase [Halioglobus sp.]
FVADLSRRRPALLLELLASGNLFRSFQAGEISADVDVALAAPDADAPVVLRQARARHMLRILWRDLNRSAATLETVRDTSDLADACIRSALKVAMAEQVERFGTPVGAVSGAPQELVVLAMGKLGAHELNVSSDIDLMFAFPEAGMTRGSTRTVSNDEFFTRVGQSLIALLDATTSEGFVFRVDMRLRPYGESGALVHNFTALEEYYQDQGRDWERYALIKARPVTGDPARSAELMTALKPFVFRRYIDFGVIESLRGMKRMINTEVRRRGLDGNVKLGRGGIREVEFIAQCFQLIRGGRDLGLQRRELLPVLEECVALNCLPEQVGTELREAYLFLRDTEHAIQGWLDRQTQELPTDDLPRLALAVALGFDDWDSYRAALAAHRERVSAHFMALIEPPEEETDTAAEPDDWSLALSKQNLAALGYQHVEDTLAELLKLRANPRIATLQPQGRARLDQFMPRLLAACAETDAPDLALARLLPLVVAVVRRSAYLALLLENPPALGELAALCGASPWIAEQLARNPVLLDELLDRASLY